MSYNSSGIFSIGNFVIKFGNNIWCLTKTIKIYDACDNNVVNLSHFIRIHLQFTLERYYL